MTSIDNQTDEELLRRAARGRRRALRELIKRYSARIYNIAYRFSGNMADAEDITQEVFIKIVRSLPKIRPDLPFHSWLFRVTANTAVSQLRKRRPTLPATRLDKEPAPGKSPLASAADAELQRRLQAAIVKLPLKYRQVIILRYLEDLTLRQISEVLEIPENTVKTQFQRAKSLLKNELKDFFETN